MTRERVTTHYRKTKNGKRKKIKSYTRDITRGVKRTIPSSYDDKIIDESLRQTDILLDQSKEVAKKEIDAEHQWMTVQTKIKKLEAQGFRASTVAPELLTDQTKANKTMRKFYDRRIKLRQRIRTISNVLPVQVRRNKVRQTFTYRGITKTIS